MADTTLYTSIHSMATQVRRLWAKGNPNRDFPYDIREVERSIRDNCHYEMKGEILTIKGQDGSWFINESYIATFILDVKNDTEFGDNYVEIPAAYMSIPGHRGFHSCNPWVKDKKTRSRDMIILTPNTSSIIEGLPAGSLEGLWAVELDKGRAIFMENCDKTLLESGIKRVRVKLVSVDPKSVDRQEQFFFPPEYRQTVISKTGEFFGISKQFERDSISNTNPDM